MLVNLEGRCGVCGGVVVSEREVVSAAVLADINGRQSPARFHDGVTRRDHTF
jgi:hypothetical protein